jgi:hypothetical protein
MLSGSLQIWMLVGIGVLAAAAGAFHYEAFDASYAMLVTDRELPRANGMMLTTWSLSHHLARTCSFHYRLAGPPAAGRWRPCADRGDATARHLSLPRWQGLRHRPHHVPSRLLEQLQRATARLRASTTDSEHHHSGK